MAGIWYYAHDGAKIGPYSARQLKDLADIGTIVSSDTVWKEGVEQGVLASRVQNLFAFVAADILPIIVDGLVATGSSLASLSRSPSGARDLPPAIDNAETARAELPLENADETPPAAAAPPDSLPAAIVAETAASVPAAVAPQGRTQSDQVKRGRAVALKGADIVSQDGTQAKFRKKCVECGHKDASTQNVTLTNKTVRAGFFCPKCRKRREVAVQCFSK